MFMLSRWIQAPKRRDPDRTTVSRLGALDVRAFNDVDTVKIILPKTGDYDLHELSMTYDDAQRLVAALNRAMDQAKTTPRLYVTTYTHPAEVKE